MSVPGHLPDSRQSLLGVDYEGDEVWLIRGIAQKLYRCPGCHGEIEIGAEHIVVQNVKRVGGTDHHHWHRRCTEELLVADLRGVEQVQAKEARRDKLEARGRVKSGRRRRPRSG